MADDQRRRRKQQPGSHRGGGKAYGKPGGKSHGGSGGRGAPQRGRTGGRTPVEHPAKQKGRRDLKGDAQVLPRWVVDDLTRVTPRERVPAALEALGAASVAMSDARFHAAVKHAQKAKKLAPRDSTVRETLALASYRVGDWQTALSELRTYRRLSGETTHLPVEMDALRALERPRSAIENAWVELNKRGGKPGVMKEGRVVFASYLIDEGEPERAYELTAPRRLAPNPHPEDLRVWYVAARSAALTGRTDEAVELRNRILESDPAFPGMDDLESTIERSGR